LAEQAPCRRAPARAGESLASREGVMPGVMVGLMPGVIFRASLFALVLVASCEVTPRERAGAAAEPIGERSGQCVRDDDCVLLPSALTCCVECPPAPPFEPAPSWVLGGMLIQHETDCAERDRACQEVRCDPVPAGCAARAACVNRRCVAVTSGCELPTT
jgi:hypothetical protein